MRHNEKPIMRSVYVPWEAGGYQWDAFYRAVKGEQLADAVTPEEVADATRILGAMAEASQTGCTVVTPGNGYSPCRRTAEDWEWFCSERNESSVTSGDASSVMSPACTSIRIEETLSGG